MAKPPKVIPINHDEYHAEFVGHTADGRQFFLTQPFVPEQREFIALYLFDKKGAFLEAIIHDLGKREEINTEKAKEFSDKARQLEQDLLAGLGKVRYKRIKIAPFKVEKFGVTFGLIADEREDEDDDWSFTMEPGNFMAFYPPWEGDYDT